MEFGFFLMQRDEAWSEPDVYESAVEQMLAAEPYGYPPVWIAEHHFALTADGSDKLMRFADLCDTFHPGSAGAARRG